MLSNLATLGKHLEMVFVQHILLCFNRRCQGSSFTAAQGCRRCWETVPLRACKRKEKKKTPDICCCRGRVGAAGAGWVRRGFPLPGSVGASRPASSPRAASAGELGDLRHGAGPAARPGARGPPVLPSTAPSPPAGLKALPSKSHAAVCDKLSYDTSLPPRERNAYGKWQRQNQDRNTLGFCEHPG